MITIGMSLGYNSSVAAINEKGKIIAAISEERVSSKHEKNTKVFPINALTFVLQMCERDEIHEMLAISHYDTIKDAYFEHYSNGYYFKDYARIVGDYTGREHTVIKVHHHTAHANSVMPYYHVKSPVITMTSDGFGDLLSSTIEINTSERGIKHVATFGVQNSLGLLYQFITGMLGFKEHQHEGKVTGLAAYYDAEKYDSQLLDEFKKAFRGVLSSDVTEDIDNDVLNFDGFNDYHGLRGRVYSSVTNLVPYNIYMAIKGVKNLEELNFTQKLYLITTCFALQSVVEDITIERLHEFVSKHKIDVKKYTLLLSGGLHANVKLNGRLATLGFKSICVAPPMGDEGTAVGCAWLCVNGMKCCVPIESNVNDFDNIFSGIDPGVDDVTYYTKLYGLTSRHSKNIAKEIALMLSQGKIVHVRTGRSEFGPRALCHSTTYYQAIDESGTKVLNKAMGRNEFMPYAPIVKSTNAKYIFKDMRLVKKCADSMRYMTVALDCTDEAREKYRGAIHVDGTCRAQILYKKYKSTSMAYDILTEYEKLTGLKMIINTSWNIHDRPTVATGQDSFDTWALSDFVGDALVHEDIIYTKEK